jgi:hypothetical protein
MTAHALLGSGHPLVRVLATTRMLAEQSVVVLGLSVASVVAALAGVPGALAATAAAVVAQAGLAYALAIAAATRRERVLDLIAEGRDRLPLAAVQRERERLLDRRHRIALADSLDGLRSDAERPMRTARPLYAPRVLAAVARDLARTAELLRGPEPGVAGIAMAELLLGGSRSPLFGTDAGRLREALRAIDFVLRSAAGPEDRTQSTSSGRSYRCLRSPTRSRSRPPRDFGSAFDPAPEARDAVADGVALGRREPEAVGPAATRSRFIVTVRHSPQSPRRARAGRL